MPAVLAAMVLTACRIRAASIWSRMPTEATSSMPIRSSELMTSGLSARSSARSRPVESSEKCLAKLESMLGGQEIAVSHMVAMEYLHRLQQRRERILRATWGEARPTTPVYATPAPKRLAPGNANGWSG